MLNKKQVSKLLDVSIGTIDRLMLQGIPYIKILRSVRFDEEKVMEWLGKSTEERKNVKRESMD